jgi:hypothetical protein
MEKSNYAQKYRLAMKDLNKTLLTQAYVWRKMILEKLCGISDTLLCGRENFNNYWRLRDYTSFFSKEVMSERRLNALSMEDGVLREKWIKEAERIKPSLVNRPCKNFPIIQDIDLGIFHDYMTWSKAYANVMFGEFSWKGTIYSPYHSEKEYDLTELHLLLHQVFMSIVLSEDIEEKSLDPPALSMYGHISIDNLLPAKTDHNWPFENIFMIEVNRHQTSTLAIVPLLEKEAVRTDEVVKSSGIFCKVIEVNMVRATYMVLELGLGMCLENLCMVGALNNE